MPESPQEKIKLVPIKEILNEKFYIPEYQRGYRWTSREVTDLLNDIAEFINNGRPGQTYCLQPLVVKRLDASWEVIDGQQRLTTIKILLDFLDPAIRPKSYEIKYATRNKSEDFLNSVRIRTDEEAKANIDFYYMRQACKTIEKWFEAKDEGTKSEFFNTLNSDVKFIWYEPADENPINVFTRLNIGKIPLTDSELIKALFLNQSNFASAANPAEIRLQQQEIAAEWDKIENTLQNDEFWLFIHGTEWHKPTRIDFIFDLAFEQDKLGLKIDKTGVQWQNQFGHDEHRTFRYFYKYFEDNKKDIAANNQGFNLRDNCWRKIKNYFYIFEEWYNNFELYHYIGFLMEQKNKIGDLIEKWEKNNKHDFIGAIKDEIRKAIDGCSNLNKQYESGTPKSKCVPLLLLFNIQTAINQNKKLFESEKYGIGAFYRFPFHLFKKESNKKNGKGWEVEHIASHAGDDLEDLNKQKIYLASMLSSVPNDKLKEQIDKFLSQDKSEKRQYDVSFQDIMAEIESQDKFIPDDKKDYIWNFTLLDSATNEEYQNAPFPIKRICILAKERGKKVTVQAWNNETRKLDIYEEDGIAFVPVCTRAVFTKTYTHVPDNLGAWTKSDAEAYKKAIYDTLKEFGVTDNEDKELQK